jgi:hypothetical protein
MITNFVQHARRPIIPILPFGVNERRVDDHLLKPDHAFIGGAQAWCMGESHAKNFAH